MDADPWVVHLHCDRQGFLVFEEAVVEEGQVVAHSLLVDGRMGVELEGLGEALVVCITCKDETEWNKEIDKLIVRSLVKASITLYN